MQLDPAVAKCLLAAGPELADAAGKSPFLSGEDDLVTVVPPILLAAAALLGMFQARLPQEAEHLLEELTHVRLKEEARPVSRCLVHFSSTLTFPPPPPSPCAGEETARRSAFSRAAPAAAASTLVRFSPGCSLYIHPADSFDIS